MNDEPTPQPAPESSETAQEPNPKAGAARWRRKLGETEA